MKPSMIFPAAALVALTGCGTARAAQPEPTVTVTRIAPPKVITRTVTHWKTRTVVQAVPDTGAVACLHYLYQQLSFDAANGHVLPNGWWDARCTAYVP